MAYTPHTWVNDELPALCDTILNEMEDGIVDAQSKLEAPQYIAYVSATFTNDTEARKFNTIQAAIDHMYTTYGALFGVTINVYPGTYTEQIHSYTGFFIKGVTHNAPSSEQRVVTLYNTGADADHYPMRGNDGDHYVMHNMNIKTDASGVFGKLGNDRFVSCNFSAGSFIEATADTAVFESWADCGFVNAKSFNLTGAALNSRYLVFEDCWFGYYQTMVFESTHGASNAVFDMDGGHLVQTKVSLKGDWYHFAKNYHSYGSTRHEFGTTAGIVYRGVTISNGIHFTANPGSFKMADCGMEDGAELPIPAGECDITADVDITGVIFSGNSMHNGLCGEIQITDSLKNVGGTSMNRYLDLVEAVKSITGESTITVHSDQVDIPKLTMPTTGTVLIDGRTTYSLTFTGDIADLEADDKLVFDNCGTILGGTVNVNGNNAEFHMHGCICSDNTFEILATSGTNAKIHLRDSNLNGSTGKSAIQINSVDPEYKITYSRLLGATGQPAIEYTVDADGKLRAKFSTFIHGDNAGNIPITNTSGSKTDFAIYACGFNASYNAAHFTNLIGSAGNIVDSAITF